MRGVAHVWPEAPRSVGGETEVAATVEWPWRAKQFWKGRRQRVFVRVPGDVGVDERAAADAFLLGTAFGAMRRVRSLHLHATATEDLAKNLESLSRLWRTRRPDAYGEVEIRCDGLVPGTSASPPGSRAILCFSGGLDSAYSLFRHSEGDRASDPRRVGAAVMVAGLDIPLEEPAFEQAFARSRRMTDSRGVPLLRASTNLRSIRQGWSNSNTATLAAVMNLFRARFGLGLVAVGFTVEEARAWWPQDETDPALVSSRAFPVVGDGYEADRFDKLKAIRGWPEALENLRVCYRRGSWASNCGECLKCLTVGYFARILLPATPACLPRAVGDEGLKMLARISDPNARLRMWQMVRHARAEGYSAPWIDETERALDAILAAGTLPGAAALRANVASARASDTDGA